jgi:hypothetical protein
MPMEPHYDRTRNGSNIFFAGPWRSGKLAKYITTLGMGTSFQLVQDLPNEVITEAFCNCGGPSQAGRSGLLTRYLALY